ncbi:hypothetical protein AURDEDRAFT_113468, partial [Auricularia subglabra TFB-10046 SS5]
MDNAFLPCLLECKGLALGALRRLQLDFRAEAPRARMLWPPDWLHDRQWHRDNYSFGERDRSAQQFPDTSYCHVECGAL